MQAKASSSHTFERFEQIEIVGLGLTGAILARELIQRKIPFKLYDIPLPGHSTLIAPGIVNPLAGKKFRPPTNLPSLIERSKSFFQKESAIFNTKIWYDLPIRRLFNDESQWTHFEKAQNLPDANGYIDRYDPPHHLAPLINDDLGSFLTNHGAWADLATWLKLMRKSLSERDYLIEEKAPESRPPQKTARIYTEGWQSSQNELWKSIPWNPAKGEMLIVEFPEELPRDAIYNKSCWLQPLANTKLWRCGATYSWDNFNSTPELSAATELQQRLNDLTSLPFKVLDQLAGVRPIVDDYKPIAGSHPHHSNLFILNGLGSKGVLQAPLLVQEFVQEFSNPNNRSIPNEWRLDRFLL